MGRNGMTITALGLALLTAGAALLTGAAGQAQHKDYCCCEKPKVSIRLGAAQANGVPWRGPCARTAGGNFEVRQRCPDELEIVMTGLAVAGGRPFSDSSAGFQFDLSQAFTIVYDSPDVSLATLYVQGYVMGLLRSPSSGTAELSRACAALTCAPGPEIASFCLPERAVGPGENASLYLRSEPICVPVRPGCYDLHQTFAIAAAQPRCSFPGHGPRADFSTVEDHLLQFTSHRDPFEGISKKDFGFHVILKVVPAPPLLGEPRPAEKSPGEANEKTKQQGP